MEVDIITEWEGEGDVENDSFREKDEENDDSGGGDGNFIVTVLYVGDIRDV